MRVLKSAACLCIAAMPAAAQKTKALPALPIEAPAETGVVRTADVYHILVFDQITAANLLKEILSAPPDRRLERFKVVARRSTKDPSSAPTGGHLGTVYQGEMVRSFEGPVLAAKPDDITGPFRSEFGWHLAYVTRSDEKPVAPICRSGLEQATLSAEGADRAGVALAMAQADWAVMPFEVERLLGNQWKGHFTDQNGNLAYLKVDPVLQGGQGRRLVTRHIELRSGLLVVASRPMGCVRSIREQWVVDCNTRSVGGSGASGYEARVAAGRQLTSTSHDPTTVKLWRVEPGTFGAQVLGVGCPQPLAKEKTT